MLPKSLTQGDVLLGRVPGIRVILRCWSNAHQQVNEVDALVSMAIASSNESLTRFIRKECKGDWVVTQAFKTQDAF